MLCLFSQQVSWLTGQLFVSCLSIFSSLTSSVFASSSHCVSLLLPLFLISLTCFPILHASLSVWSLCCLTLSGVSAIRVVHSAHKLAHTQNLKCKKENYQKYMSIKKKKKLQFPTTGLNSSRCMFDICLTAVPRGKLGERLVKISHMFSLLPLLPCLFHSVCADPLMSVSQALCSHRRSLAFWLSLLWARCRGLTQGSAM